MRRWLRLVPVVFMGSFAIAYVLARPALLARVPNLAILEFPVGAIVVAFLMWAALSRRTEPAPSVPWRRHVQVVREVPDPALAPDVEVLERWVESGESPERAADVLARATTNDPRAQERVRHELAEQLAERSSRRKRESLLKKHIDGA